MFDECIMDLVFVGYDGSQSAWKDLNYSAVVRGQILDELYSKVTKNDCSGPSLRRHA